MSPCDTPDLARRCGQLPRICPPPESTSRPGLPSIPHRPDVLGFYTGATHAAAVAAKAVRHLSDRHLGGEQAQQQVNMQLALVLAPGTAAESDELVVARVEA
jgi:hypothetical protein